MCVRLNTMLQTANLVDDLAAALCAMTYRRDIRAFGALCSSKSPFFCLRFALILIFGSFLKMSRFLWTTCRSRLCCRVRLALAGLLQLPFMPYTPNLANPATPLCTPAAPCAHLQGASQYLWQTVDCLADLVSYRINVFLKPTVAMLLVVPIFSVPEILKTIERYI
jgi:hypothetical protein